MGGLVRFNDYQYLNLIEYLLIVLMLLQMDLLIILISKKQIKALKQVKEWGLLHNGKRSKIDEILGKIRDFEKEYENNSDMLDLIKIIF